MPVSEPTNSTRPPFSLKLPATQSAGITCPPVPPPAIRIRGPSEAGSGDSSSFTVLRYPAQDANGGEADQQARTAVAYKGQGDPRSEEHTSELQSRQYLVCRLLIEKKNTN